MSALAYFLRLLSFLIIVGCAWLVARYGAREFVKWRQQVNGIRPVKRAKFPVDRTVPIYSQLAAERPETARLLARQRRRLVHVTLTADTTKFTEQLQRVARSLDRQLARVGGTIGGSVSNPPPTEDEFREWLRGGWRP